MKTLRKIPQWVCWKTAERDGRATKLPVNPVTGDLASATDPRTWGTYEQAVSAVKTNNLSGVGFVLTESAGFVCVDLDHVRHRETGAIDPDALEVVNALDTYTEVSPSGDGLHLWMRARPPAGGNRKPLTPVGERARGIEIYWKDRYLTVTFRPIEGRDKELAERTEALGEVHAKYIGAPALQFAMPGTAPLRVPQVNALPDADLLAHMFGAPNGPVIQSLWDGNLSAHGNDHSGADQALANHLAFWTNGDRTRIDRMFRQSRLMREKWDRTMRAGGETYGALTIAKAIATLPATGGYRGPVAPSRANPANPANPAATAPGGDHIDLEEFREVRTIDNPDDVDTWTVEVGEAAYRGLAGDAVRLLAERTEADPAAILLTFLAAFGVAVGSGPHAELGGTIHYARTHALIVGDTAVARKGDSWNVVDALMTFALEDDWGAMLANGLASGEGLISALSDELHGADVEKRRIIYEPEFARTLRAGKREHSTLSSVLRQAWETNALSTLTKAKVTASRVHVAVLGHITAEELIRESTTVDVTNGFINRFAIAYATRRRLLPSPGSVRQTLRVSNLPERVRIMIQVARKRGYMDRDPDAEALYAAFYHALPARRQPVEARAEPMVTRLSIIYALLEGLEVVSATHLQSAIEVWWYSVQSARKVYGYGTGTGDTLADRILTYLRTTTRVEDGTVTVMQSEIQHAVGRNAGPGEVNSALLLLERQKHVTKHRRTEPEADKRGRQPVYWRLAPALAITATDTPAWVTLARQWPIPSFLSSPASNGGTIPSFLSSPSTRENVILSFLSAPTHAHADASGGDGDHRTDRTEKTETIETIETIDKTEREKRESSRYYSGDRTDRTELPAGGDLDLPPDRRPAPPRPGVPVIRPEDLDLPIDWEFAQ